MVLSGRIVLGDRGKWRGRKMQRIGWKVQKMDTI